MKEERKEKEDFQGRFSMREDFKKGHFQSFQPQKQK